VWAKIISDGRFMYHQWTVKSDPDAVFFADRLRVALRVHREGVRGVYLNNCKFGMHGPLEVLSREAVRTWAAGSQRCLLHFHKACSGPCFWGEDMFMDQCLSKVLLVKRDDDFNVLVEDHCDPPPGWQKCLDGSKAAFHPFKNPDQYKQCWDASIGR